MTDVTVNTGTTMGISATLPTTFDAQAITGYTALTFIDVGEVIDIGEIAKAFAGVEHQSLSRAYKQKLKDTFDISNVSMTLGKVTTNTGQAALQTALASSASVAFELVLPSGDIVNLTGKVMKAGLGGVASGAISTTVVDIAIDPESLFES